MQPAKSAGETATIEAREAKTKHSPVDNRNQNNKPKQRGRGREKKGKMASKGKKNSIPILYEVEIYDAKGSFKYNVSRFINLRIL